MTAPEQPVTGALTEGNTITCNRDPNGEGPEETCPRHGRPCGEPGCPVLGEPHADHAQPPAERQWSIIAADGTKAHASEDAALAAVAEGGWTVGSARTPIIGVRFRVNADSEWVDLAPAERAGGEAVAAVLALCDRYERIWLNPDEPPHVTTKQVRAALSTGTAAERAGGEAIAAVLPCSCLPVPRSETLDGKDGWRHTVDDCLAHGRDHFDCRVRLRAALSTGTAAERAVLSEQLTPEGGAPRCWRSECRSGCCYPDVCSEHPTPEGGDG